MHNFQSIRFLFQLESLLVISMSCYGYAKKNFLSLFLIAESAEIWNITKMSVQIELNSVIESQLEF